jgi:hypothetical protein
MAKTTKKRTARSKQSSARPKKLAGLKINPRAEATTRSDTKQHRAIEMLRSKGGASLAALMKATGWQQHSVRGFLAGVVRKRLKLDLVSAVDAGVRTYRIADQPAMRSSKGQSAQSKSS